MRQALARDDPTFEIWKWEDFDRVVRAGYRYRDTDGLVWVTGDFNRDTIEDIALTGHEGSTPAIVAVLSRGSGFVVEVVSRGRMAAGDTAGAMRTLTLRRAPITYGGTADAITVRYRDPRWPEWREDVHYWDGKHFVMWGDGE